MIRVLLVDDEKHAIGMLHFLLQEIGNVNVVGTYTNPLEALEAMKYFQPDGIFLDIEMPGMNGLDLARAFQAIQPRIQLVFTTAYTEHAIEAFEIRSLDYLLKPIRRERLRAAVNRIREARGIPADVASGQPVVQCMSGFAIYLGSPKCEQLSWRTTKEKELCAFLVHQGGQTVEQSVILEALWPEADADKSRAYLYTCISLLRKNLRSHGLPLTVSKIGRGYALQLDGVSCDALEIDGLIDMTMRGEGLGVERLEQLVGLYKGYYLMNCDYRWGFVKREQLSGRYTEALRQLCIFFKGRSQIVYATECLRHILEIAPDSEKDGRELIKLFLENDNRSEAIKVFKHLERSVKERLDIELEEETVKLYEKITSSFYGSGKTP